MPKGVSKTNTSAKRSETMKRVWKRKDHKLKVSEGQKKTFATSKYKEQQSNAQAKRWSSEKERLDQSKRLKNAWNKEGKREEWSVGIKESNTAELRNKKSRTRSSNMLDPNYSSKGIAKTLASKKKTIPEKQLESILSLLELPYMFVGNGKLMIGRYCPDFVRVDCKAIIEVYSDYWHKIPSHVIHDKVRDKYIKKQRYKILVIWQSEINNIDRLVKKIKKFDNKVLEKATSSNHTQIPSEMKVKV